VLEEMFNPGRDAAEIITQQGLSQIGDSKEIEAVAVGVIEANPKAVADYRAGKSQSLKFLVGQVMRATRGRANPNLAAELLEKKLGKG
jgi:aspartyl-tRNA(Asn)/glutamyl-tRNA(Gln) amidotransferase subunit B